MKKIRISESELVNLIEKLVKENLGNGVGQVFPLMGTPSEKYKDLLEKEDIEETDEISEDETNIDTAQGADQTLNLNIMNKTNQEDWMEGIEESKLINRLKTRLNEDKDWVGDAYADAEPDKLTDYCGGKVTCSCVSKALKDKDMRGGAQLYLNTHKDKCKSLKN
tara:strand:- start:25 stop:519 length:495 start_codon:yes stop_codon:yes gene_type:complete